MSVESLIGGFMVIVASVANGEVDSRTVWNTAVMMDKASQHKNWSGSAKEEGHQILKDIIIRTGQK